MRVQDVNSAGRTVSESTILRGMLMCFFSLPDSKLRDLGRDIMQQLW